MTDRATEEEDVPVCKESFNDWLLPLERVVRWIEFQLAGHLKRMCSAGMLVFTVIIY